MNAKLLARVSLAAVAIATVGLTGITSPATAATSTEFTRWNTGTAGPGQSGSVYVKCPSTYPYANRGYTVENGGAIVGSIVYADYPSTNTVGFTNPHPWSNPLKNVVVSLYVTCTSVRPAS